jgi:omega-6 fatty acid desaturase (delta-12 desaturase)
MQTRTSQELIRTTKKYAREVRWLSWWHLGSTLAIFIATTAIACQGSLHSAVRLMCGVLSGMVLVRMFILYHDFQHGTILKGSRLARAIMTLFGLLTLNPPSIWNRSHNHHHKNNAKVYGAEIGSYPVMTIQDYRRASRGERLVYLISRHPLTIAAGYLTIFLYGMCIRSLMVNPRHHFDSAVAIAVHGGLLVALLIFYPGVVLAAVIVPSAVAAAAGAYLFYAQHNYPEVMLREREDWDYVGAALDSSSYLKMSRFMHWFTGNIGYHHVHHLNAHIPFYRLPEAMAAIEELQSPGTTSLSVRDIARCTRLKLWDPVQERLVSFSEVPTEALRPQLQPQ